MTTPRNNYELFESPYAKHLSQYPSQSEDFLPLDLGGPCAGGSPSKFQTPNRNGRYTSTPSKSDPSSGRASNAYRFTHSGGGNFYQNKQNRGRSNNPYFGEDYRQSCGGENFGGGGGSHRGYQNNQRYSQRHNARGSGGGGEQKFKSCNDAGESFFHPSMLEDPWRELMERHIAIGNSRINISTQQQEQPGQQQQQHATETTNSEGSASVPEQLTKENF